MSDPLVVSGLKKKRAELVGKIEALQSETRKAANELAHVEATLRLFDPDINFAKIRPKKPPAAYRAGKGEISQLVLEALRESPEPLTTLQLADVVTAKRGLDADDKALVRTMRLRVGAALRYWEKKRGMVQGTKMTGRANLWRIAEGSARH